MNNISWHMAKYPLASLPPLNPPLTIIYATSMGSVTSLHAEGMLLYKHVTSTLQIYQFIVG